MKIVKVKDVGVQVKGISYFKNAVFEVTDEDFEPIKEYVDVLSENKNPKVNDERIVTIKVEDKELDLNEVEVYLYNCLENFGKEIVEEKQDSKKDIIEHEPEINPEGNDEEDEELEALKERATKLGIKVTSNMKKETIIKKIEECEKKPEE